jgi:2-polyprenyl-3-methyl-5-hydroxy-6-metoxy-1,4-benzoquinol methylase
VSYATIDALRGELDGTQAPSAAYAEKMMHPIPPATSVDRSAFILTHVTGKNVMEFGASGPMHDAIAKAAGAVLGIDRESGANIVGFDLDDVTQPELPKWDAGDYDGTPMYRIPDIIVCGEVLEHLGNPLWFLTRMKRQYPGVPVIITVPNAFMDVGRSYLKRGIECVNADHVAWYSPKTLSVLLQRAGYAVGGLFWYGGQGPTAEGLIVVTE